MKTSRIALLAVIAGLASTGARASNSHDFNVKEAFVSKVINGEGADSSHWKMHLPLSAQHINRYYSKKARASLNESNLGLGFGRSHQYGPHEHELYVMAFEDSHNKLQLNAGYNYSYHFWKKDKLSAAVGLTAGLTSRDNLHDRVPFPYLLPTAKVVYGNFELSALYVPDVNKTVKPLVFIWGAYKF